MKLLAQIGTITQPGGLVPATTDPESMIAGIVRGGIQFLIVLAFIVGLIWTIFAGFRFITAGGDEKAVSSAWSQIYWGLIGLVVVVGAYAIIRLVEIFFVVNIISGGFQLPQR